MAGRHKTSPKAIAIRERQNAALNLRKGGIGLREIARQLGFASPSGAYEAIRAALAESRQEAVDEYRDVMAARLDSMLAVAWENALAGDLDAVAAVLRIEERRAKLFGLDRRDAPVKVAGLPKLEKAADALAVVGGLLERATAGELSPDEAGRLAGLAGSFVKLSESVDLEARVAALAGLLKKNPNLWFAGPLEDEANQSEVNRSEAG
ncbi:MAG: hypothetical protein LBU64_10570 [Planctomycetota bacterium]|jgi:hypothetical protein|nr:hypothetical protein [Planctomycetota bacterium]